MQWRVLDQSTRCCASHQHLQPIERHFHLAKVGHEGAELTGDLRQPANVRDKQREITDGEASVDHRSRRKQQQDCRPDIGDVGRCRAHKLRKHAIGEQRATARLIQLTQVSNDARLGVRHFDRQRRAEYVAQQTRDIAD